MLIYIMHLNALCSYSCQRAKWIWIMFFPFENISLIWKCNPYRWKATKFELCSALIDHWAVRVLSYCKFWIYWVGVNTKFTIWQPYCKFCIYTHPVNSKFTIWQFCHTYSDLTKYLYISKMHFSTQIWVFYRKKIMFYGNIHTREIMSTCEINDKSYVDKCVIYELFILHVGRQKCIFLGGGVRSMPLYFRANNISY